ncbi:MAG: LysM peptidoglycan-binding domain-containing protein [Prosthecobacter sp.]|nr:LysM peptidoglycan-binding domain-containing protein [Prosthecobacter sp.]
MARTQLKLLLFLIVLGITLGCMAAAYYIYDKVLKPEKLIQQEMADLKKSDLPRIDPGTKRFEAAVEMIRAGRVPEGRDALYKLVQQFPNSDACPEARRIIGEINLDELFSTDPRSGRRDYIVQPGDSLALIAGRQGTTMDMLIRLNGLMSTVLQPGDHLAIVPLDFSIDVDISARTVTLFRNAADKRYFFKEYRTVDLRLPPSVRPPLEAEIRGKAALIDGRAVLSTDPRYVQAEKWLPATRPGQVSPILALRTPPAPKPAPAPPADGQTPAAALPEVEQETGVFLAAPDLEEMFALVRNGSKLHVIR